MPGTFVTFMDDGDGSGAVDIVGSAPDALATTANYIASLGWADGLRWGVEVAPLKGAARDLVAAEREHACLSATGSGSAAGGEGAAKCRTVEQWLALGVTSLNGQSSSSDLLGLPAGTRAALLAPSGADGPAWLVTRNYQAIWGYNRADAYALSIGLLANALRGEPAMRTPWPTDDVGLSRAEMRELQQLLIDRGHADVIADGYDGPRTREAIRGEERLLGWVESGRAGGRIARALKEGVAVDKGSKPVGATPVVAVPPQGAASDVPVAPGQGVSPVLPAPSEPVQSLPVKIEPSESAPRPEQPASQPVIQEPTAPSAPGPQPAASQPS
jgi:glucose-6-phosphate 1-epimerase